MKEIFLLHRNCWSVPSNVARSPVFSRIQLSFFFRYFDVFKSCFSPVSTQPQFMAYQACTEVPLGLLMDENKLQRSYTKEQAFGYVKFIAQFDFACGAGFGGTFTPLTVHPITIKSASFQKIKVPKCVTKKFQCLPTEMCAWVVYLWTRLRY